MSRRKRREPSAVDLQERLDVLRRVELFSGASGEDLGLLARSLQARSIPSGAEVVREGRLPTHVFVIGEGRFEVVSRGERGGEQRVVNVLTEGDHFGEIGLIEGMPATATVRADGPAQVFEIPGEDFLTFVDQTASLTEVADRISTWLARTHPSYRPSAGGGGSERAPVGLGDVLADWAETDLRELEAALARLAAMDPERRRTLLRELGV